jgi:hypothetical protein
MHDFPADDAATSWHNPLTAIQLALAREAGGPVSYESPKAPADHNQKGLRPCRCAPNLDQQESMAIGDETAAATGDILALNYAAQASLLG